MRRFRFFYFLFLAFVSRVRWFRVFRFSRLESFQACGGLAKFEISQNLAILRHQCAFGRYPKPLRCGESSPRDKTSLLSCRFRYCARMVVRIYHRFSFGGCSFLVACRVTSLLIIFPRSRGEVSRWFLNIKWGRC